MFLTGTFLDVALIMFFTLEYAARYAEKNGLMKFQTTVLLLFIYSCHYNQFLHLNSEWNDLLRRWNPKSGLESFNKGSHHLANMALTQP